MRGFGPVGSAKFAALVAALASVMIVALCLLPQSRYLRFSVLHEQAVAKTKWIYERTHFDPTPTDVVVVGTSHTVYGVNSARIEQQYHALTGNELHVVNFGLEHLGRDLEFLLVREVLRTRPVKLLVVEVQEDEPRSLHPAFGSLADPWDLVTAPVLLNVNYLDNLAHLPMRQVRLAAHSLAPALFGERTAFDPAAYAGPHWNNTDQTDRHTAAELEAERRHYERTVASKLSLPGPLKPLETRANLLYLTWMLDEAARAGVPVRFLYMPSFAAHEMPHFQDFYAKYGPLWYPQDAYAPVDRWFDVGHLNHDGAMVVSDWVADALSKERLRPAGVPEARAETP